MKIKILITFFALCGIANAQGTWTQKADFGGTARAGAVGFSIGTKGYIGISSTTGDFWEWDQATNTWTQQANFPDSSRFAAVGFSIGTKGYIGTGNDNGLGTAKDFWEFDPNTTGVNEFDNKISVSVFPNPTTGIFTIQPPDASTPLRVTSIEIINVLGEQIQKLAMGSKQLANNSQITIDLSSQPRGIYFYTLRSENKNPVTGKLIIQ